MTFYACAASRNRKRSLARTWLVRPIIGWKRSENLLRILTADAGVLGIASIANSSLSVGRAEGCGQTATTLQPRHQKSVRWTENRAAEPS